MSVNHSRAPTAFSSQPPKTHKNTDQCHFLVIDSENEDEPQRKIVKTHQIQYMDQLRMRRGRSQIQGYPNRYEEQCLDFEIMAAEQEIRGLEKECCMLEGFISEMAAEQAALQVQIRVKQRRKSVDVANQRNHKLECPIHGTKIESLKCNIDIFKKTLKEELLQSNNQQIGFTTPLLSRNNNFNLRSSLDEAKTVDVNESGKKKKQSRPSSQKKQLKDKQNRPVLKEIGKKRTQVGSNKKIK